MTDTLLPEYDFTVIGAGPAGLLAALTLAGSGKPYRIALLDKRDPWREPVSCAEAVHRGQLEKLVRRIDPEWVRGPVDGAIFVAPDGTPIRFEKPGAGLFIDRALMQKRLAGQNLNLGVHCNFRARAVSLSRLKNGWRTLKYEGRNGYAELRTQVVIDCSGPGAGFGWGENITQGNFDVEPAVFALVRGLKYPANYIQMFFGKNYAPGGYAWLFPRDAKIANVGLVVGRDYARGTPARPALKRFLEQTQPGAEIIAFQGGAIPCGYPDHPLAADNLYKAGDAANMVHPISRAGIVEAMTGGRLAATAAMETISMEGEENRKPVYAAYKSDWDIAYGKAHRQMSRVKKAFMEIPDGTFNRAAHVLARSPSGKPGMGRILFATLWQSPLLLWKMRGLL